MMIVRGMRHDRSAAAAPGTARRTACRASRAGTSRRRRRRTAAGSTISIGPGCTPWMIIAAISTAEGAEPGIAERERRNDAAGDRRVVAGLGGHQALDRALAVLLRLLARALGGRVRRPRRHVLADAGQDADVHADHARSAGSSSSSGARRASFGITESTLSTIGLARRLGQHGQDLGEAERADQRGNQRRCRRRDRGCRT